MSKNSIKVLIVEDEPIILNHIVSKVSALSDSIQVVAGVESAKEALEILKEQKVDILLTDIEMADVNGLELIKKVKEHWQDVITVILSGYDSFKYAQTAIRHGVDDYLLKPVDLKQLSEVFGRLIKIVEKQREEEGDKSPLSEERVLGLAQQVRKFIKENFDKNITMAHLVEEFNYAPSYLSRVFKKEYGLAPMQYQTDLRVERAQQALEEEKHLSIKEIAALVGYEDARYFSRVFRQATDVSPSDWGRDFDPQE